MSIQVNGDIEWVFINLEVEANIDRHQLMDIIGVMFEVEMNNQERIMRKKVKDSFPEGEGNKNI